MTKDFIEETMSEYRAKFGETYCNGNCLLFNEVIPNFLRSALLSQRASILAEVEGVMPKEKPMSVFSFVLKGEELEMYMKRKGWNEALASLKEALSTLK